MACLAAPVEEALAVFTGAVVGGAAGVVAGAGEDPAAELSGAAAFASAGAAFVVTLFVKASMNLEKSKSMASGNRPVLSPAS